MYGIERYLNVRSAFGASMGPEGNRLCFRLNTTGTPQLWSLTGPGAWPEQHTFFDERVTFGSFSPERQELVFGKDVGGNERTQFHRLDLTDGTIQNLTQQPDAKHRWGGWSHDGDRFAFSSNRRDESVFDVYVQDRTAVGDDADLIYEGEGWLTLAGWSPDDSQLLVTQAYSGFDQDLYVLDIETGELNHLTPHEGTVRYNAASWGPDGENVYLVTDRETDTLRLERLAVDSGEFGVVETEGRNHHRDDEWNVGGLAVDQESRRIVYGRNVEGYTEWTTGELAALDRIDPFADPNIPTGVSGGISFGPDGDRFAITVTSNTDNANIHVVDIRSGETERWTAAPTAGIPRNTFVDSELVHYPSFDDREFPPSFRFPRPTLARVKRQ